MAPRNALMALAAELLTPEGLPIAEEVANKLYDQAMEKKDMAKCRRLTTVLDLIDGAKSKSVSDPAPAASTSPEPKGGTEPAGINRGRTDRKL